MQVTRCNVIELMNYATTIQLDASGHYHHLASMHVVHTSQMHHTKEGQ